MTRDAAAGWRLFTAAAAPPGPAGDPIGSPTTWGVIPAGWNPRSRNIPAGWNPRSRSSVLQPERRGLARPCICPTCQLAGFRACVENVQAPANPSRSSVVSHRDAGSNGPGPSRM